MTLSTSTATLTIGTGGAPITVTVTRTGNVTAPVELSLAQAPAGVTGRFEPSTLAAGATFSALTLLPSTAAAAGQGSIVVSARSGALTATATITATLQPAPDFSLTVDSSALSIPISGSTSVSVRIARNSALTGDIQLGLQGLPNGVTATFAPAILSGSVTTSTLTLAAGAFVPAGSYALTLTALAPNVLQRERALAVHVTQAGRITVRSTPRTVIVVSGTSNTSTITVTRIAPFTGPVTLVTPTLGNIGFQLSRTVIPAGDSTAVLTVTAPPNLSPFTLGTPLLATGLGVPGAADTIGVAVSPAPSLFSVIPAGVDSILVSAAAPQRMTLRVYRGPGFTTPLAFTAFAPPAGMQVRFTPSAGVIDSTVAEVIVAPTVPAGRYLVDFLADGGGNATFGATLKIRVLPAGSGRLPAMPQSR